MKPLHVLALVVLAAGALIFAIFAGKGDSEDRDQGLGPVGPATTTETADPGDLGAPERLTPSDEGARDVADTEEVERAASERSTPGRDWDNALVGSVFSPKGEPVGGAKVRLTRVVSQQLVFVGDEADYSHDRLAKSKADGSFRFEGVEPFEAYALVAMHDDFARTEVPQVSVAPEGVSQGPRIVMKQGAVLRGYVRDTGGATVPGAALHLDGMLQLMEDRPNPDRISTVSNAEGFYEFRNVPHDSLTLSVEADGYGHVILAGLNFTVRKDGPQEKDIVLEPAEMICGKVVGPGNVPVPDARVIGISYSNQRQQCRDFATTDAEGRFCLEHVYAGKYTVAVNAEGFRPGREQRVEAGETNLVFELTRQAVVRGTVYALDTGRTVSNFRCELRHSYENNSATSPTEIKQDFRGTDGSFELQNVPPGNYVVQATADGYAPTFSDPFRLTTEKMLDGIVVRLSRGATLTGTVLDASGSPVGGARVSTHDNDYIKDLFSDVMGDMMPSNATSKTARTSASGEFSIDGLRPATYQVRANAPGYCELIKNNIVAIEGKPTNVGTLKMIRGGSVRGRILDPAGKGLIGADVLLRQTDQTGDVPVTYETKSGDQGKYAFLNVEPGVYMISATGAPMGEDQVLQIIGAKRSEQPVTVSNGQESRVDVKLGS